jgi:hypothetical protein
MTAFAGDGSCEVTATRGTSAADSEDARPSVPYPEPLATAVALAFGGTFVATVALLTAGGVVSALLDSGQRPSNPEP